MASKVLPDNVKPRELLWYHQIQRENRHLLERLNKQQKEIETLNGKLLATIQDKANIDQELIQLRTEQDNILDRRRQDFDREKELLKRFGSLETTVTSLSEQMAGGPHEVVVDVTASEHWRGLEQRLNRLELRAGQSEDVVHLKRQMVMLEATLKKVEARVGHDIGKKGKERTFGGKRSVHPEPKEAHRFRQVNKENGKVETTATTTETATQMAPAVTSTITTATTKATAPDQTDSGVKSMEASIKRINARAKQIEEEKAKKTKSAAPMTPAARSTSIGSTPATISTTVTNLQKPTTFGQISDGNKSPKKWDEGMKEASSKRTVSDKENSPVRPRFPQKRRRIERERRIPVRTPSDMDF